MKVEEVPQDGCGSVRKGMYALDDNGNYTLIESSGWQVEKTATRVAITQFDQELLRVFDRCRAGESAPLAFHMCTRRMDVATLADAAGIARWRVRRHLRPTAFARLPQRLLARYAQALQIPISALGELSASGPE